MTRADDIKKKIEQLNYKSTDKMRSRILSEASKAMEQTINAQPKQPGVWRIIMQSKMTKFAVASVVLLAVIIGVQVFDIQPDGSSIAFAEMIEAMNHQGWVYSYLDNDYNISERWVCFEDEIEISHKIKDGSNVGSGRAVYTDLKKRKSYVYTPQNNTIIIEYASPSQSELFGKGSDALVRIVLNRPQKRLKSLQGFIEHRKEKPVISHGVYRGRKVQIQKYGKKKGSETEPWLTLYIDPVTKMLVGYVEWAPLASPPKPPKPAVTRIEEAFDFPDSGPQSIYDVGVPRDARVIDRVDVKFNEEILPKYKQYRSKAVESQTAVITQQYEPGGRAYMLDPDRSKKELVDLSWPLILIYGAAIIIEDNYSKDNGFIGLEYYQHRIYPSGNRDRVILYLNPDKGYICQRRIFEWGYGSISDRKVTEYQQVDGLWYPATVELYISDSEDEPFRLRRINKIHLDAKAAK